MSDTAPIAAIATAPGRAGIGVVRVSGRALGPLVEALVGAVLKPRRASYRAFRAADGQAIDRGIAILFPAPNSYTGEEVLELQGHGGPVVMQLLLRRVLEAGEPIGIRLAQPGEFTQRAFLNDRLDLAQAEAVADLIDAGTEQAARSAVRSLAGEFSHRIEALVESLIGLRTLVEATLDFPEEEIDFLQAADAHGKLGAIRGRLEAVMTEAHRGALLREGLNVVLVGEPNVGKSSLLNALAGAEVAIVTAVPGTTRDRIAQAIQIEGMPINVVDTAGLRETSDEVERIGITRTWDEAAKADVVLHLLDASNPDSGGARRIEQQLGERIGEAVPVLRVFNKIDLGGQPPCVRADAQAEPAAVWLSARTGEGLELLRRELLTLAGWQGAGEGAFIARERHLQALRRAREHLAEASAHAAAGNRRLDLFAEELRLAQERLNEITGAFGSDDLLGEIFGRFCIGK